MAQLVIASLVIDWFKIKVAIEMNIKFLLKIIIEKVVLKTIMVDEIDIYIRIAMIK